MHLEKLLQFLGVDTARGTKQPCDHLVEDNSWLKRVNQFAWSDMRRPRGPFPRPDGMQRARSASSLGRPPLPRRLPHLWALLLLAFELVLDLSPIAVGEDGGDEGEVSPVLPKCLKERHSVGLRPRR